MNDFAPELARDGFATRADALPPSELDAVVAEVEPRLAALAGAKGGVRDALNLPAVRRAALLLRGLAVPVLGDDCVAVSATIFDKAPSRNWKVPFHQDVTIQVRERREVPGFDAWRVRGGVAHCRAAAGVLELMLAVRLHLDDCGPANGPLRVLPGSHAVGVLEAAAIDAWPLDRELACPAARGGALLPRPLLLHASSAARTPARRRVLHVEFAAPILPGMLTWRSAVGPGA